jgi:hypothetical protein
VEERSDVALDLGVVLLGELLDVADLARLLGHEVLALLPLDLVGLQRAVRKRHQIKQATTPLTLTTRSSSASNSRSSSVIEPSAGAAESASRSVYFLLSVSLVK